MSECCVCGFNPPSDPNEDCERCRLIARVATLEAERDAAVDLMVQSIWDAVDADDDGNPPPIEFHRWVALDWWGWDDESKELEVTDCHTKDQARAHVLARVRRAANLTGEEAPATGDA